MDIHRHFLPILASWIVVLATSVSGCASIRPISDGEPCPPRRACPQPPASDDPPKLIPLELLFGQWQDRYFFSPDGDKTLRLRQESRRASLHLTNLSDGSERVLLEAPAKILEPRWANDGRKVLVAIQLANSSTMNIEEIDIGTGKRRTLYRSTRGLIRVKVLHKNYMILTPPPCSAFSCGPSYALKVDLSNGKTERIHPPPRTRVIDWGFHEHSGLKAVLILGGDGQKALMVQDSPEAAWRPLARWDKNDNAKMHGFSRDGRLLLMSDNRNSDTMRLYWFDITAQTDLEVFHHPSQEIARVVIREGEPVAVLTFDASAHWHPVQQDFAKDLDNIRREVGSDFFDMTFPFSDPERWLVHTGSGRVPPKTYRYDRKTGTLSPLPRPEAPLSDYRLADVQPVTIPTRDGLELPCYLSLPEGAGPFPLVLYIHGGPEARFYGKFDAWLQFLVNRGYAVVQVNFRGSDGCGKKLLLAGRDARFGGKTAEDLEDVVRWAQSHPPIDASRVALFGFSYGGYAALIGAALNPELYSAGIDGFGPSNLVRLSGLSLSADRSLKDMRHKIFDERREQAKQRSPVNLAERVAAPLLIAHGRWDENVSADQSEEMVAELRRAGRCVQFVLYPDEAHGFSKPQNAVDFAVRVEEFLARHLCGRAMQKDREGE